MQKPWGFESVAINSSEAGLGDTRRDVCVFPVACRVGIGRKELRDGLH
ncbi:hypothetical protein C9413_22255 [Rhizobium sp. SEMIA 4085]|nr:hypothetical protein [Rhizobium sp. SEMIA 4085]